MRHSRIAPPLDYDRMLLVACVAGLVMALIDELLKRL
jgi:hypothetical protein